MANCDRRDATGRAPVIVFRTVPGTFHLTRPTNAEVRGREYLTEREVDQLLKAARDSGRYGQRDATMILLAYWHGLRVGELVSFRWDQVNFATGHLFVRRLKGGLDQTHPLGGTTVRELRKLQRDWPQGPTLFQSERGTPLTADAVRKIVTRAGQRAGFAFPVHPHMLRHACSYRLVNDGVPLRVIQDFLGHRNIQHTHKYTSLSPTKFEGLRRN